MKPPRRLLAPAALTTVAALVAFRPGLPGDGGGEVLARLVRQVATYYAAAQLEKAYLHLDRDEYGTGETIWLSACVVDAQQHRPDSLSGVLHVELLSPQRQVLIRRELALRGGFGQGDVALPDTLPAGTYLLRAYTDWMRNAGPAFFYSRRLAVWPASPAAPTDERGGPGGAAPPPRAAPVAPGPPDVQLLPEGGTLVATLPAVLGVKALDGHGRGLALRGEVLDAQGQAVASFATPALGMSRCSFVPAAGQHYRARVQLPGGRRADYPLPAPQPAGYALHVSEQENFFVAEVRYHGRAGAAAPGPALLLAEVRGFLLHPAPLPVAEGTPAYWRIAKAQLPAGVLHLTLFDGAGQPQAERLAFVPPAAAAGLRVALVPDQAAYAPHRPVQLTVRVRNAAGQPVAARLSVAVVEAGAASLDPGAETIASHLLLTSDLAGDVENPGCYFRQPTAATARALDDLLLTQGWRRFAWPDVLADKLPAAGFAPEQGIVLAGQVVSARSYRPVPNSPLVASVGGAVPQFFEGRTGPDGRFRFQGFPAADTITLALLVRRLPGEAPVLIRPDPGPPAPGPPLPDLPPLPPTPVADYLARSRQQRAAELALHPEERLRTIRLADVAVTGRRATVAPDDPRRVFGTAGATVLDFAREPLFQTSTPLFQQLEGRVPGLTISANPPAASIRGGAPPVFVLDGVPAPLAQVANLQSADVEAVEVFKGTEGALFGGSGGAIAIYTKQADAGYRGPRRPAANALQVRVPGFYRARQFYVPRYDQPARPPGPDPRRLTLYWNPAVQTSAQGEATLRFFTADGAGRFQVTAEGLAPDGQLVQGTGTLVVTGP